MATHTHPAAIQEHGLQDGCERCAEHAQHPFDSLDTTNMSLLAHRTLRWMKDEPDALPRSDAEEVAMRRVERAIREARALQRLGIGV